MINNSILVYIKTLDGAVTISVIAFIILAIIVVAKITKVSFIGALYKMLSVLVKIISKKIGKSEQKYRRDLEIGKIDEKRNRVKTYKFLNDLNIDLGLKQLGATPYELLFICLTASAIADLIISRILFKDLFMILVMYPIITVAIICALYTKANISHDVRIESIIEAENIICNNIKDGVVVAVKTSINLLPTSVRESFKDFVDNIEHKNYHVRVAFMELNQHLGSTADDFIKKCILFETEEEHGSVGMFKDIVEINNIKTRLRISLKHQFEKSVTQFIIGASMIFVFLTLVLAIYKNVAEFYFSNTIGQILIAVDILIVIGEFVYLTYLRAQEL